MVVKTRVTEYEDDSFAKYLRPTDLCNFDYGPVRRVGNGVTRGAKTEFQVISSVHEFVSSLQTTHSSSLRQAHKLLSSQQINSNEKTVLFISFARLAGVACRVRAFMVAKEVFKPLVSPVKYVFLNQQLLLYPEVFYKKKWMLLSEALYSRKKPRFDLCPFDDARRRAKNLPVRKQDLVEELGVFWHPDTVK
ncbi:MAG: hypothetical protein ACMXYD_04025 [Candidatus Woesearchaeota archaeon]